MTVNAYQPTTPLSVESDGLLASVEQINNPDEPNYTNQVIANMDAATADIAQGTSSAPTAGANSAGKAVQVVNNYFHFSNPA